MHVRTTAILAIAGATIALGALAAEGSVDGPEAGLTGGFGETTCHGCHFDNPLNDPVGELRLDGVPDSYTPGEQYLITVTVRRIGLSRGGFQLTARESGINMASGSNAGVLRPTDAAAQTIADGRGVTYLQHTRAGAEPSEAGLARWTFEWAAPAEGVPVVFHVAANAANGDDSPLGDFVYTAEATSTPGP